MRLRFANQTSRAKTLAVIACVMASASHATSAGAAEPVGAVARPTAGANPDRARPELGWRWKKFGTANYALTGLALTAAFTASSVPSPPWRGPRTTGFDTAVRDAIRLGPFDARRTAGDVSDLLLAGSVLYPMLFDGVVTAWGSRHSPDVAREMVLIDLETLAVAGALNTLTTSISGRERPYATAGQCERELGPRNRDCLDDFHYRYRSFFSGHTTLSFTGAALACNQHLRLGLYGERAADVGACVGAFTAAAATGTLRVMSDQHYATDVITGALVGTAVGFGLPWLLHYRHVVPAVHGVSLVPTPSGVNVVGLF